MRAYRTFQTAMRALRRNVMRAALTTLGIVIGVAAVIAMMEIGNGSSLAIQHTIATMGAYNLMVFPGNSLLAGISHRHRRQHDAHPEDADAIVTDCPSVAAAAPVVRARAQAVYNNLQLAARHPLRHHAGFSGGAGLERHGARAIRSPTADVRNAQQGLPDRQNYCQTTLPG